MMAGGNPKDGTLLPAEGMKVVKEILDWVIALYGEMILGLCTPCGSILAQGILLLKRY